MQEETTAVIGTTLPTVIIIELSAAVGAVRLGDAVDEHTVRPFLGDDLPAVTAIDGLVVTGSDLSAHDDEQRPIVVAVAELLSRAVELGVPVLAVGAGAQALAVACGGHIEKKAPTGPETGLISIRLRPDAAGDPVLGGVLSTVGRDVPVPAAHLDAITELPDGAIWLASSNQYPFQAFRIGSALGVQFQPQASAEDVVQWDAHQGVEADRNDVATASAWDAAGKDLESLREQIFEAFAAEATDRAHIALR